MKKMTLIQALLGLILLAGAYPFIALHQWLSFLGGLLTIFLNFLLLGWGWGLIFKKKLIALAVGIIVFKYAILGIIIFKAVKHPWFHPFWFCMGVASFVISALIYSLSEAFKEGKDNVI